MRLALRSSGPIAGRRFSGSSSPVASAGPLSFAVRPNSCFQLVVISINDTSAASSNTSGYNIIPFAVMAGGWLAPLLMFWLYVWGPLRPFSYPTGDLFPNPVAFSLGVVMCVGLWWIPRSYFRIRRFELDGRAYELLGVASFRRIVPDGELARSWQRRRNPSYRVIRNRTAAAQFVQRTEDSERGHLALLAAGVLSAGFAATIGWEGWAAYLFVGNIVVNVYPIMLQRYTRARLAAMGLVPNQPSV